MYPTWENGFGAREHVQTVDLYSTWRVCPDGGRSTRWPFHHQGVSPSIRIVNNKKPPISIVATYCS